MQQTQLMRTTRWQLINTPWMFSTCRENLHCRHCKLTRFFKRKSPNCYRQDVGNSSTSVPPRVNWTPEQNARRKECGARWKARERRIPIFLIELMSASFAITQTQEHSPRLGEVSFQINDWQSADSGRAAADTSRRIRDTVLRMSLGNLGTSQRAH